MDRKEYMKSIDDKCNELKNQYEKCFNAWFSQKFLKGVVNDSMCTTLYSVYQQCLKQTYDDCFNNWFLERFLKGDSNDSLCAPLLKVYKECIEQAMKDQQIKLHDIEGDHLGTDKEKVPQS